ncbi:MAG: tetratricopeptide repeat protein, partial [Acidobacteriota bacterium]|nr:tetratricopeptide repeat protein [Acidobacteriota bacterium]
MRASEVLSLIAGKVLPEDIVADIAADHLAFRPDDYYRGLLKTADADPKVIAALDSAQVDIEQTPEAESGKDLLEGLADAASAMNSGKKDQAAQYLKAALAISLNSPDCYFVVGQLLLDEEQWLGAQTAYNHVLAEDADYPDALTKLSYVFYREDDGESALQNAEAALKQNPDSAESHKNAALALEKLRQFDAAEKEYQSSLRLKSDYTFARYDLGNLYRESGQPDKAIEQYRKALTLNPDYAPAHNNLGYTLQMKGDLGDAIREYREATRLDPSALDARQNLAYALEENGMYGPAVKEYRQIEEDFPNSSMCH